MTLDQQNEIFDLYQVFVNNVIGDVWLSIIIFLIVLMILSIKARMPFEVTALFAVLVITAMFSATGILILWVFTLLFVGSLFYWFVSKAIQQ